MSFREARPKRLPLQGFGANPPRKSGPSRESHNYPPTIKYLLLFTRHNIANNSLYFVRSGYIDLSIGRSRFAGYDGNYWPSIAASNIWGSAGLGAYHLVFDATNVYPSNGPADRWLGFPLRCLKYQKVQ